VYGLVVQEHFGDLVVGTYGRGFYILDDLSPLRRVAAGGTPKGAELFPPRQAYRFRGVEMPFTAIYDPVNGFNPTYGASVHYWLPAALKGEKDKDTGKEKEEVEIRIEDSTGKQVRTFKGPAKAGLNRAHWDLEFDKTTEAKLRTSPRYASYMRVPPEGITAPAIPRFSLLAPPGTYTVKMKVGEAEMSQPVTVVRDPGTGAPEADLTAQIELARDLADDLSRTAAMVNAVEDARGQLAALNTRLGSDAGRKDVRDAAEALDKTLLAFEEKLFQVRVTGRGQDLLRWPAQLAEQLGYLLATLTAGDFAPTASQRGVHTLLHDQTDALRKELDGLIAKDLAEFNKMLGAKGLLGVVAKP
jgi:hypothetical protein